MPICPNCGEDNPDRARFCLACAAPLAAATPGGTERKVVSVLFCDLVGFTADSDAADPEDVQARLRPYHGLLKREIERFGGTVEKFIGDAVMAVFGAPVAHEDDAERAVRAALRITEAIPDLNAEHPGLDLAVRAAVNTGEAVVTLGARPERGEGIVAGDVVNTASRLQQVAPAGGVVVGEMTYRATRDAMEYSSLEPVAVKGKTEPLSIWVATGPRSRYAVEIERPSTPFIGRDDELALVQQTFNRTLRESSVQLVTVAGEPGVGKSRLIAEFSSWVDDRPVLVYWRQGRCLPYGEGITFWALGEIVKAHAGILESDSPEDAHRKLTAAVHAAFQQPSEREWMSARLSPLVGLPAPPADREESFAAWRSLLEAAGSVRPLVLVVEDLHWADDAMLEFIEHVVDWSTDVPMLVVCTARPELYERRPDWGGGKRNAATIMLSPLTEEETARLVAALLSEAVLPAETHAALLEHSGGNPLYAEEFVRMLTDRDILERRGRSVRIAAGAEIRVPETVQALIAARLDTLPPDRKALLHDASVVGKVFWSGAVAEMGRRDERAVRNDLHELARKELIRPVRRSTMEDQAEYAFWHVLVRDVAYSQIPRAARAAKHRAAAEWIEGIAGDRVADHSELLAHHFGQAVELARAAGVSDQARKLEERARQFLVMAGDRAMRLDVAKAESYFRSALALLPPQHPDRPAVRAKMAGAAWQAGRFPEAQRAYEEAIAGFEAAGDMLGAGEAKVRLADMLHVHGETAVAERVLAEAVALLERLPPSRGLASAYVMTARRKGFRGRDVEALQYSDKGLALATKIGAREQVVRAHQFRGFSRLCLGDPDGVEDLRESLRLGLEWGLGLETAFGYLNLGDWVWLLEGPARGLDIKREGIAFARRRGLTQVAMWTAAETTWTLFEMGRWDELLRSADEVAAWEKEHTGSQLQGIALPSKARVLLFRGRLTDAASLTEALLPLARKIGDNQVLLPTLGTAALVERARGDLSAAVGRVEEWIETVGEGTDWLHLWNLPDVVEVLIDAGSLGRATALVEGFVPRCAHEEHTLVTVRARVAEAGGDPKEAARLYGDAAERWAGFGNIVERARCLLGAGRCLVALGPAEEAGTFLRGAGEIFVGLGARPMLEETDDLLARLTALTS